MSAHALPPSALEKLSILAGHWHGERAGAVIDEMWLAPAGGVAQGTVRLVRQDAVGTIELIIVAAEADRVVMRYNHFYSNCRTREPDGPIELTLSKADKHELVFSNLAHPPRHASEMGYRLTAPDALSSWVIAIEDGGKLSQHDFDFTRVC